MTKFGDGRPRKLRGLGWRKEEKTSAGKQLRRADGKPGDEVGLTVEHDRFLVHNVFLLTSFNDVNFFHLFHRVRLRTVRAYAHLIVQRRASK